MEHGDQFDHGANTPVSTVYTQYINAWFHRRTGKGARGRGHQPPPIRVFRNCRAIIKIRADAVSTVLSNQSGNQYKSFCSNQMPDCSVKMHQIQFRLGRGGTRWGNLKRSPTPSWCGGLADRGVRLSHQLHGANSPLPFPLLPPLPLPLPFPSLIYSLSLLLFPFSIPFLYFKSSYGSGSAVSK